MCCVVCCVVCIVLFLGCCVNDFVRCHYLSFNVCCLLLVIWLLVHVLCLLVCRVLVQVRCVLCVVCRLLRYVSYV